VLTPGLTCIRRTVRALPCGRGASIPYEREGSSGAEPNAAIAAGDEG